VRIEAAHAARRRGARNEELAPGGVAA